MILNAKKIIFILFNFIFQFLEAQATTSWNHKIQIELDCKEKLVVNHQEIDNYYIEFYVNEYNERHIDSKSTIVANKINNVFSFDINYYCSVIIPFNREKRIKCPDIYLKIEYDLPKHDNKYKRITRFIPFTFEMFEDSFCETKINKIKINEIFSKIDPIIHVNKNGEYKILKQSEMKNKLIIWNLVKFEFIK